MFDKPLHIYDMHEEWLMMFKSYLQIERYMGNRRFQLLAVFIQYYWYRWCN